MASRSKYSANPAPATIDDEGLADVHAANPFRLPRLHPGIGFGGAAAAARELARLALEQHLGAQDLGGVLHALSGSPSRFRAGR